MTTTSSPAVLIPNHLSMTRSFPCTIHPYESSDVEVDLVAMIARVAQWLRRLRQEGKVATPIELSFTSSATPIEGLVTAHVDYDPEGPASRTYGHRLPQLQALVSVQNVSGELGATKVEELSDLTARYLALLRHEYAVQVKVVGRIELAFGNRRIFLTVVSYLNLTEIPLD